ncbi:MAG: class I SAM-dependent methyltransferase [Jatrophihabitantaceae bacterium]
MTATCARPAGIDARRWPDIVSVPHNACRAAAARALVRHALRGLPLRVSGPDGWALGSGTGADPLLRLRRPDDFYHRLGAGGLIGFGEAFMAGDWDSGDGDALVALLTVLAARLDTLVPPWLQRLRNVALAHRPVSQDNTPAGARANIRWHYDLSNELFALFLDESMTYSAALFTDSPAGSTESLAAAQRHKIDRLLDAAGVRAGSRVLEIGTGWGELAIRAAARGARVSTITISTEQARLARERVAAAGFGGRVEVRLADYRELRGQFDAVLSVEMIEAVGANHWQEYFTAIERLLAPGGRAALQAITMPHERMLASCESYTWIVKYIFPGGQIPSVPAIESHAVAAGLRVGSRLMFGAHYAETLRRWRVAFDEHTDAVARLGFDDTFQAMWRLYLAYSEAGFRSGYLDVAQVALTKPAGP